MNQTTEHLKKELAKEQAKNRIMEKAYRKLQGKYDLLMRQEIKRIRNEERNLLQSEIEAVYRRNDHLSKLLRDERKKSDRRVPLKLVVSDRQHS